MKLKSVSLLKTCNVVVIMLMMMMKMMTMTMMSEYQTLTTICLVPVHSLPMSSCMLHVYSLHVPFVITCFLYVSVRYISLIYVPCVFPVAEISDFQCYQIPKLFTLHELYTSTVSNYLSDSERDHT